MHIPLPARFVHPHTGVPLTPLGFRKDGRPIWPIMGGSQPTGEPPAAGAPAQSAPPAAAPPPAAPPPAVPAPALPPPTGGTGQPPATGGDQAGFPANTPWREMTPDQQVSYWQHQSRRHEERVRTMGDYDQLKEKATQYEQLVAASQTEHERAVAEARRQGHAEALAQSGSQLVEQWVRAAAVGRLPEENVNVLLEGLDRTKFLTAGGVDTDKVWSYVTAIASQPAVPAASGNPGPTPPAALQPSQPPQQQPGASTGRLPDFGQGQAHTPNVTGLEAGREIARRRFGTAAAK